MDIVKASIVTSTAGRDKGSPFYVLDCQGDFLLLADGKRRPVERPKRKRRKHAALLRSDSGPLSQKIRSSEQITNSELRKAIAAFRGSDQDQEG